MSKKPTYEELEQRVKELEAEKNKFNAIIDSVDIGIDIVSYDYKVQFQNKLLADRFGDLRGKLCYKEYMNRDKPCSDCPAKRAIENNKVERTELIGADGRNYELISTPIKNLDGTISAVEVITDITERKQAEEALREREERLQQLMETVPIGISTSSPEGDIVEANETLLKIFGYRSKEDFLKTTASDHYYNVKDRERFVELMKKGSNRDFEAQFVRKDDTVFWGSATSLSQKTGTGEIQYINTVQDITERKQAEKEIRNLAKFPSENPNPVLRVAKDGLILHANEASQSLLNIWQCEVGQALPDEWCKLTSDVLSSGSSKDVEVDCDDRIFFLTFAPVKDADYVNVYGLDITERKQAEEALKTQARILDSMVEGVNVSDENGIIFFTNPAFDAMFGYEPGELIGKHVLILNSYSPEENARIVGEIIERLKTEEAWSGETNNIKKDGTQFITYVRVNALEVSGKQYWISVQEDITDRKRAEEELRKSEERLRSLFKDALDMIHILDEDGKIVYANPAELETMAYTRDEYIGKHILEIVHPDYQSTSKAAIDSEFEGKEVKGLETAWITKHGKRLDVEVNAVPQTAIGKVVSIRTITRNITESKQAEEEKRKLEARFQKAQKMEAIGTLAGGIAHDFNNLLTAVQGNASLMLYDIDSTHPHYEMLEEIIKQSRSGVGLTAQLLGYARKGRYDVKPINLNRVVEETSYTFGRTHKEITIHQELAEDLFGIKADQSQIEQVLLNLFINAAAAMPREGTLTLKSTNVTHEDIKNRMYNAKPGSYVLLTVTDTGTGMDKETRERIFEPFFTTKEMGRGTGLGLASVYGTIKGHGGYIHVDSEKGRGTTFSIYLPASDKKIETVVKAAEHLTKGSGTILLIDDEALVLKIGIKMLEKLGYTVLEAKSGREAIETYKANKDKIDLVLLDMIMPDMGGGEVYDRMKEINPDVKVLLSSGYSIEGQATEILERGCDAFIQKPFDMAELYRKVGEFLDKE